MSPLTLLGTNVLAVIWALKNIFYLKTYLSLELNVIKLVCYVCITSLELLTGVGMSGDEVLKKLKQNVNNVHILTLMAASQDGAIHMLPQKWGPITKLGCAPQPQPKTTTEHDAFG